MCGLSKFYRYVSYYRLLWIFAGKYEYASIRIIITTGFDLPEISLVARPAVKVRLNGPPLFARRVENCEIFKFRRASATPRRANL